MRMNENRKPIGLTEVCRYIEDVCRQGAMFSHCGRKPKHLLLAMDPGEGRTTLIEYIVDMYKAHGVLPFSCGLDDYVEVVLDGTIKQLRRSFAAIQDCATYANSFENVAAIDITAISHYLGQSQCSELMTSCSDLCESACVIFFTSANRTRNEERLVERLMKSIKDIEEIIVEPYTTDELYQMVVSAFGEKNVVIENEAAFAAGVKSMLEELENPCARTAMDLASEIMACADYTAFPPVMTQKGLKDMQNDWKMKGA